MLKNACARAQLLKNRPITGSWDGQPYVPLAGQPRTWTIAASAAAATATNSVVANRRAAAADRSDASTIHNVASGSRLLAERRLSTGSVDIAAANSVQAANPMIG